MKRRHLILGNGPAGVVAAETLARYAPNDEILLYGCEGVPPYSRMAIPYLLEGQINEQGTWLRKGEDHFARLGITLSEGRAVAVDQAAKQVLFADGTRSDYDTLLIATGSSPLLPPIPGIDLPGVTPCWTLAEARTIAKRLKPGVRVVQMGAGFIGAILLETFVQKGAQLTVVEVGDRMVPRMLTPRAGNLLRRWVEARGVAVRTGCRIEAIAPAADSPLLVRLSSGEELAADLVIVAAGVRPNISFLAGTTIQRESGILVDAGMRTSDPAIFAAGDCAQAPDLRTGQQVVAAIQPNAVDQGRVAAIQMAGGQACLPGVLAINVLDTLGLVATSFGQWQGVAEEAGGSGVEWCDEARFSYISLQFQEDRLIGATTVGFSEHTGVLRGLIQGRVRLGPWHERLLAQPLAFVEAFLARAHYPTLLAA